VTISGFFSMKIVPDSQKKFFCHESVSHAFRRKAAGQRFEVTILYTKKVSSLPQQKGHF